MPLYLDLLGLTTRRLHHAQVSFQIDFDFVDHQLVMHGASSMTFVPGGRSRRPAAWSSKTWAATFRHA